MAEEIKTTVIEDDLSGHKNNNRNCPGARIAKRLFPEIEPERITWGNRFGFIDEGLPEKIIINSSHDMMDVQLGTEVTLTKML